MLLQLIATSVSAIPLIDKLARPHLAFQISGIDPSITRLLSGPMNPSLKSVIVTGLPLNSDVSSPRSEIISNLRRNLRDHYCS